MPDVYSAAQGADTAMFDLDEQPLWLRPSKGFRYPQVRYRWLGDDTGRHRPAANDETSGRAAGERDALVATASSPWLA
jgi:hypothetical protein